LLELGSNYPEEIPYEDRQQTAYFESHDDSPQWWHVTPYNEKTNTCELETVERNCLYTMDAWVLAWMARELGLTSDAVALEREHGEMAKRINELLWDEHKQCYFNRRWTPENGVFFNPQMAPDIFMSLLGKVAPEERTGEIRRRVDPSDDQQRRSSVPETALLARQSLGSHQLARLSGIPALRMGRRGEDAGGGQCKDVPAPLAGAW
jgi:hypothetical protein